MRRTGRPKLNRTAAMMLWCLCFLLAVSVLAEALGYGWVQPWAIWRNYPRVRRATQDPSPHKIIAIGSSYTDYGFIPLLAEKRLRQAGYPAHVHNVADGGHTIGHSLPIVRDALLTKNPPRLLLVGVSSYDFRGDEADAAFRYHLAGPRDLPWLAREGIGSLDLETCLRACFRGARVLPQLPILAAPQLATERKEIEVTSGGAWLPPWTDEAVAWDSKQLAGPGCHQRTDAAGHEPEPARRPGIDPSSSYFRRNYEKLRQLILAVQSEGVTLVVVYDPIPREAFASGTRLREDYEVVMPRVAKLCAAYDVPFYDVNSPQPPLAYDAFCDRSHLGPGGAARYTELLVEHAILPALVNAPHACAQ